MGWRLLRQRSLGRHRLKDLTQSQEIFQIIHPALPADFPPLRSLESVAHNLPGQLTSFVGREQEMTSARSLLKGSRLLTLTGMGGMGGSGKSRLAVQVAAESLEDYPDGVWLVEQGALTDPTLVPQAVAAALELREEGDKRLTETLVETLQPKTLLLILDNCEHLIEACARLADDLLRGCPKVTILATSREALDIGGEILLPLSSLSLPFGPVIPPSDMLARFDSVRLFVDRATTAQPMFQFSAGNAPAVAQVCSRLDGIPLALELAAARVKVLSPEQIAARLDDHFRLLSGGSRTALPRQQPLRALIDWSYDLLLPPEQTVFRRLSIFAGGWSLEAAETVCTGGIVEDWAVLDLLSHLVSKSLVVVEPPEDGQVRYHLLENLRQYARERLAETDEVATLPGRQHDWFIAFAEEARPHLAGPEQAAWLNRLERDHDNFRLVFSGGSNEGGLRLAGALYHFWLARGYFREGLGRLETFLTTTEPVPFDVLSQALTGAGVLAWSLGDNTKAQGFHERSLSLERDAGSKKGIARALANLGIVAAHQEDFAAARPLLEESLALYREIGSQQDVATLLHNLGSVASDQGDLETAQRLYEESLAIFRSFQDTRGSSNTLFNLGTVAFKRQRYAEASLLYKECLILQDEVGNKADAIVSLLWLGFAAASQAHSARAVRLLAAATALLQPLDTLLTSKEVADSDQALDAARATLGDIQFEALSNEALAFTYNQVVQYALESNACLTDPA